MIIEFDCDGLPLMVPDWLDYEVEIASGIIHCWVDLGNCWPDILGLLFASALDFRGFDNARNFKEGDS